MITCFVLHVWRLMHRLFVKKELDVLWGPASMTPQPRDVAELHRAPPLVPAPRPAARASTTSPTGRSSTTGRCSGGWAIIGGSGLVLWFPVFFSHVLPGSWFNIALLVHGEEGLLAVGFIFTIHFFNSHLRPDKFPMDPVIFTGRVSAHELQGGAAGRVRAAGGGARRSRRPRSARRRPGSAAWRRAWRPSP